MLALAGGRGSTAQARLDGGEQMLGYKTRARTCMPQRDDKGSKKEERGKKIKSGTREINTPVGHAFQSGRSG